MEPCKEILLFQSLPLYVLRVLSKGALPPGPPHRAPIERDAPFTEPSLISLKVPCKAAPSMYPQQCPYAETLRLHSHCFFIHLHLLQSPVEEPSHEKGETYGHRPRSPTWTEGLHRVGCSLVPQGNHLCPQCHAAFSTVTSTLAWVDQSPVSQCGS
jgi:hypothetical protein